MEFSKIASEEPRMQVGDKDCEAEVLRDPLRSTPESLNRTFTVTVCSFRSIFLDSSIASNKDKLIERSVAIALQRYRSDVSSITPSSMRSCSFSRDLCPGVLLSSHITQTFGCRLIGSMDVIGQNGLVGLG